MRWLVSVGMGKGDVKDGVVGVGMDGVVLLLAAGLRCFILDMTTTSISAISMHMTSQHECNKRIRHATQWWCCTVAEVCNCWLCWFQMFEQHTAHNISFVRSSVRRCVMLVIRFCARGWRNHRLACEWIGKHEKHVTEGTCIRSACTAYTSNMHR